MAVKEMKATTDIEGRKNFQHEIQLLRRLSHPNILEFIGVFILKVCYLRNGLDTVQKCYCRNDATQGNGLESKKDGIGE